ncbi:MAG: hypothetical protein ACTTJZ_07850 [Sphaerochaetaceae bacterium]
MRVFNQDKTQELAEYDLGAGYLIDDEICTHRQAEVVHHPAVAGVKEQGHHETVAEYPNGGKDVAWIIYIEGVEAREAYDETIREAYDETERIQVYIPYTPEELTEMELKAERTECERWLQEHDYIGIKIATGRATVEEYADVIAEMSAKADRINEIDGMLI